MSAENEHFRPNQSVVLKPGTNKPKSLQGDGPWTVEAVVRTVDCCDCGFGHKGEKILTEFHQDGCMARLGEKIAGHWQMLTINGQQMSGAYFVHAPTAPSA